MAKLMQLSVGVDFNNRGVKKEDFFSLFSLSADTGNYVPSCFYL